MGNMLEFPISTALASFESTILNTRCHKNLRISVKGRTDGPGYNRKELSLDHEKEYCVCRKSELKT